MLCLLQGMGQLLCRWALSQSPPMALYVGVDVGFHIEPGLHHAAPDESLESSECKIQGMEILPFSCFEKVS